MFAFFPSLQETYETKRKEFLGELQKKEEEMRQMFVNKVKETEAELKEKEREVGVPKTCERSPKYSQHRIWVWATYESWKAHAALEQTSPAKAQTHTHAPSPTQKRGHRVMFSKQHHWFRRLRNSSLPHPVQCG